MYAIAGDALGVDGVVTVQDLQSAIASRCPSLPDPSLGLGAEERDERTGRLGPKRVRFDQRLAFGRVQLERDGVEVRANSNFCSLRANVSVFAGRWMFEVTLVTAGLQQLGWAPFHCAFTEELGVGDVADSYAYDGHRKVKWNIARTAYGQDWAKGDVIGCLIDVDAGCVEYLRNGHSLGVAFDAVRHGVAGLSYFPALSLSQGETALLNFGAAPFRFAQQGYEPLQGRQWLQPVCTCAQRLLPAVLQLTLVKGTADYNAVDHGIACEVLFDQLEGILGCAEVVAHSVFPWLQRCFQQHGSHVVQQLLETMCVHMSPPSFAALLHSVLQCVSSFAMSTPLNACEQLACILPLATAVMQPVPVLQAFVSLTGASELLCALLVGKSPGDVDLVESFFGRYQTWEQKKAYAQQAQTWMGEYEDLAWDFCDTVFLSRHEPCLALPGDGESVSPRALFYKCVAARVAHDAELQQRQRPTGFTNHSAMMTLYWVILRDLQPYMDEASSNVMHLRLHMLFVERDLFGNRLGGIVSHLHKSVPSEQLQLEEESCRIMCEEHPWAGGSETPEGVTWHLNLLVTMHTLIASKMGVALNAVQTHQELVERAKESKFNGDDALKATLLESSHTLMWNEIVLSSPRKMRLQRSFLGFMCHLLLHVSKHRPGLFGFVPCCFLDCTLITMKHMLVWSSKPHHFPSDEPLGPAALDAAVAFTWSHIHDHRIVNPDNRATMLVSLSVLTLSQQWQDATEACAGAHEALVPAVLRWNDDTWPTLQMIFTNLWLGRSLGGHSLVYGDRHIPTLEDPLLSREDDAVALRENLGVARVQGSAVIQSWLALHGLQGSASTTASDDSAAAAVGMREPTPLFNTFVNKLFNLINMCISDFTMAASELGDGQSHTRAVAMNGRRLFVAFDLTVQLLRVLEIVAMDCPGVFLHDSSIVSLQRVAELIPLVIGRMVQGAGGNALRLLLQWLGRDQSHVRERANPRLILPSLMGTVLGLVRAAAVHKVEKRNLVTVLVQQGALTEAMLAYIRDFEWETVLKKTRSPEVVELLGYMPVFLDGMRALSAQAQQGGGPVGGDGPDADSADLCPICCAADLDTTFVPCGHRSCALCVQRHLLNSNKCFFCQGDITSTTTG